MDSRPPLRLVIALAGALVLSVACTNPSGSVGTDAVDTVDAKVPTDVGVDLHDGGSELPPVDGTPADTIPDGLDVLEVADGDVEEVDVCQPMCDATECGDDGCGGSCGECGADEICFFGSCAGEGEPGAPCDDTTDCESGICVEFEGAEICSQDCIADADCWEGWVCVELGDDDLVGCVPACEPTTCEALAATCGTPVDDCGGILDCGVCGIGATCTSEYVCVCDFTACGAGCCPEGMACVEGVCCGTSDATCDGVDDDCDGQTDDGYVAVTDCGLGVCLTGNTASTCVAGVETPCQPGPSDATAETVCDGLDNDCDGSTDEDYLVDDACGLGACQGGGTPSSCVDGLEIACAPGAPLSDDDATCDGVDDDCDGDADEDFLSDESCGLGWCGLTSTPPTCTDGVLTPCQPGGQLSDLDTACDGVDEDCDGDIDEDYVVVADCGVGACSLTSTPSSCVAGFETACAPGPPLGSVDGVCDGVDDDCDGFVDEDVPQVMTCGIGACQVTSTPSSCVDGVYVPCQPGEPLVTVDTTCNFYDDDCDGDVDEDADPPCSLGNPVSGLPLVFGADLGLVSGVLTDSGDGIYSDMVIDLSTPNRAGQVWAGVQGSSSAGTGFQVIPGAVDQILVGASRSTVYFDDSDLRIVVQVLDEEGGAAAPSTPVEVLLWMGDGPIDLVPQSLGDGLFSATYDIPQAMFEDGALGTVYTMVDEVFGETLYVTAVPRPTALSLSSGEAGVRLPTGPRFTGSTFDVPVVVNTGGNVLGSYNILLDFDASLLEVTGVKAPPGSAMGAPISNLETTANELGFLSFNGINVDPGAGSAVGAAYEVARVEFTVRESAPDGADAEILGQVVELYNTGLSDIRADAPLQIWDGTGQGPTGVVLTATRDLAWIFALAQELELLDLQVATGNPPSTTVKVHGLREDGVLTDITQEAGTVCDSVNEAVAFVQDCVAFGTGPGTTAVAVSAGDLDAIASVRVLSLQLPVQVAPLDATLGYISSLEMPQSTRMTAHGVLSDGAGTEHAVNLTGQVGWFAENDATGTVDGSGLLTPVSDGLLEVQALGPTAETIGSTTVSVDFGSIVSVVGIEVLIPAKISMTGIEPSPVPDAAGATTATAEVTDLFTSEGQQVQSIIRLILSDDEETGGGSRMDVTGDADLVAGIEDEDVATIDADGVITAQGSGDTQVIVGYQGPGGGVVATGAGVVSVQLPQPVLVTATVGDPRVALSAADVSHTILGLPVTRQLTVSVQYADGTVKDLTDDPRTIYTAVAGLVAVDSGPDCAAEPGCQPGRIQASGAGVGIDSVQISFSGSYLSALSTGAEIQVVSWDELVLESWEEFTPAGLPPMAEVELSLIEGTGIWQGARATLRYVFTDGSEVDVTTHPLTSYVTVEVGGADPLDDILSISEQAHLIAASAGSVDLIAQNSGNFSGALTIGVLSFSEDVVELEATYAGGSTFSGVKDVTTGQLDVYTTFTDGTRRMLTGASLIEGLLVFDSGAPEHATIDPTGLMAIHGNGPVIFEVDVAAAANTGQPLAAPAARYLAANLVPDVGDVDLGNPSGLPFPDRSADEIFSMPVRVNTGGSPLGGLDLEILYDPDVIEILDVSVGSGIPGAIFSANPSKPGVIYLNAAPSPFQTATGAAVEVAVITCKAIKLPGGPSITPVGGTVVGVVDDDGGTIGPPTPRPIVAGDGDLDPEPDQVFGDANDDGIFSIADVLFVQQIIVVPPIVVPNETQLSQSDVFPDGKVASNDALFSSLGLARLAHFVELSVAPVPGDASSVHVTVTVTDRDQASVEEDIQVRLEVGTWVNRDTMTFTQGHAETVNGLVTGLADVGGGDYETLVEGLFMPEEIGLVVIVDILGPAGEVFTSTAFLGTPEVDPVASFLPLDTYLVDICTPFCDGKFCGEDDGCGLPCDGICPGSYEICADSLCVCEAIACDGACCAPGLQCVDGACCQQFTCDQLGAECGTIDDGCGGILDCGDCGDNGTCVDFINLCQCLLIECGDVCCGPGEDCKWGVCTCSPQCDGASCGDPDGCGGLCDGPCPDGDDCVEGSCCVPNCDEAACGADDGCGGACQGACPDPLEECIVGSCVCLGKPCGPNCCGPDEACENDACIPCVPETCQDLGASCGALDDGCGGSLSCGDCGANEICTSGNVCECAHESCGGGCCALDEICDAGVCKDGCLPVCQGAMCGDPDQCGGFCDGACAVPGQVCWDGFCCTPNCAGKSCGAPDGCNGICEGPCPGNGEVCVAGVCCAPDCAGASCGDPDGCGGACAGPCPSSGGHCVEGECVCLTELCGGNCCLAGETCIDDECQLCLPQDCGSQGVQCGLVDDGCGFQIFCGDCVGDGQACIDGTCQCTWETCGDVCCDEGEACAQGACCQLQCDGAACGDSDGCGGLCDGSCAAPDEVCHDGACCAPDCPIDAACGTADGCGGFCSGVCPDPDAPCIDGVCQCATALCGGDCCGVLETCEGGECVTCEAGTCQDFGAGCGFPPNGCGGVLFCGDCGPDGSCGPDFQCICDHEVCGGVCCGAGAVCYQDQCWTGCVPDCDGKLCGANDGCDGACNDAPCPDPGDQCYLGICCEPKCAGKDCGESDGCGGVCDGPCPQPGEICIGGSCCVPSCDGMGCGESDGCGSVCQVGPCESEFATCSAGVCLCDFFECDNTCCAEGDFCVDDVCTSCTPLECADLGLACGSTDSGCGFELFCGLCPPDEACVDGACECAFEACGGGCCADGEACYQDTCCAPDCAEDAVCGDDDGCGGQCDGTCAPPEVCTDGVCCAPDCSDAACGDLDGCGGTCVGVCPDPDEFCTEAGICTCLDDLCGGDCCTPGFDCVDDTCVPCQPETCADLGAACGVPGNGCGGVLFCGSCGANGACGDDYQCDCDHVTCAGACCPEGEACYQDQCWSGCVPDCDGKLCGDSDGCGGQCVDAPCAAPGAVCNQGICCTPVCDGTLCGDTDGCGGVCGGPCPIPGQICADGACCAPSCAGKACGADDGCGGACLTGSCVGASQACIEGECVCLFEACGDLCCPNGHYCIDGACEACEPLACGDVGWACGALETGCGFDVLCGECGDGQACVEGVCQCAGETCVDVCCPVGEVCHQDACCVPECVDAACGDDDGCGGLCDGDCENPLDVCLSGACCAPDCLGAICGDADGCDGACLGACPDPGQICNEDAECVCLGEVCDGVCCAPLDDCIAGLCVPCTPDACGALGLSCGQHPDGCGLTMDCGDCGPDGQCQGDGQCLCDYVLCEGECCSAGEVCHLGQCFGGCVPQCAGKFCGASDGCGGECNDEPCPDPDAVCNQGVCCVPTCDAAACGDVDGCGGLCNGTCTDPDALCVDGTCCVPDCAAAACGGDDGCGGWCLTGSCPGDNSVCVGGACQCEYAACDDLCCPAGESCLDGLCSTCEPTTCITEGWICGILATGCGDGTENCGTCGTEGFCVSGQCACFYEECGGACCPEGSPCLDGACCAPMCDDASCGEDDGCGGVCVDAACPEPFDVCVDGACCTPLCVDAACGDPDQCGGTCFGPCPDPDALCNEDGVCQCVGEVCDGDCCPPLSECVGGVCAACEPDGCDDLAASCGNPDDGCGGTLDCGACGDDGTCGDDFQCDCDHLECGGVCCAVDAVCFEGQCWIGCVPDCLGKSCGDADGCGGTCVAAPCADPDAVCNQGICCVPVCDGTDCGDTDGCGGLCNGPCPVGGAVCLDGACCTPDCADVDCGAGDGCGGFCPQGACPDDQTCLAGACQCDFIPCGETCCADGEFCIEDTCVSCESTTCAAAGVACGVVDSGCGFDLECGLCPPLQECVAGQCGCAFVTCGESCCDDGDACLAGVCCAPVCDGVACGDDDGCGGLCPGTCDLAGEVCFDGMCCTPDCDQAPCGADDGCGGACLGPCPDSDAFCSGAGQCTCPGLVCAGDCCPPVSTCEEGVCVACVPFTCEIVGGECGILNDGCGGTVPCGSCGPNETCQPNLVCACDYLECGGECCSQDAVCYQGQCWTGCVPDCAGKLCGDDDGCGGTCPDSPCAAPGEVCYLGACCAPDCDGKACGAQDSCGGVCDGPCPGGVDCVDGVCCETDCAGKACGAPDGCGGSCPLGSCTGDWESCVDGSCECIYLDCEGACCGGGEYCLDGVCAVCDPLTCADLAWECGDLDTECGFVSFCGLCPALEACVDGECFCEFETCAAGCCDAGEVCEAGACCLPDCAGASCGAPDGCGGLCDGPCPVPEVQCVDGACCLPNCAGKDCGDSDGCGGTCIGDCGENQACIDGACACIDQQCGGTCCPGGAVCLDDACCVPSTCLELGAECGVAADDCGGFVDCGGCAGGENCTVNNVCGCLFESCSDVCCDDGQVCHEGACCAPETCADVAAECGAPDLGCGVTGACGACGAGETCGNDYTCSCEFTACGDACCAEGQACSQGSCCTPECGGKSCGDSDGCGGVCDHAPCGGENQVCIAGFCFCEGPACLGVCCAAGESCIGGFCTP